MTLTVEGIGKYLGKMIEDSMGRSAGRLVGLTTDIKDELQAVQIAHDSGEVNQYPIRFIKVVDGRPILLEPWRVEAEDLRREYDVVKRRSQALDLLFKDGDIDQLEYNQLRSSYEGLGKEIGERQEKLLGILKQVEGRLEQLIRDLQTALTNNKMLYTASEIDQQTYETVTDSVRTGLEIARKERKDIDNLREYLHGIGSLELPKAQQLPQASKSSRDVVVIKMREPT